MNLFLEQTAGDLRQALRALRNAPGFACTGLLTIALGIGAASAIFAVVDWVLVRPLPYSAPESIGLVWVRSHDGDRTWLSAPELDDLTRGARTLKMVAGLSDRRFALTGRGDPEELSAVAASASLQPLLGVPAALGRWFEPGEDREAGPPVAVLSEGLWRRRFGAASDVLGSSIMLEGRAYTIVGVVPASFSIVPPSSVFPSRVDVWVPLQSHLVARARDIRYLHAIARLDSESTFQQANQEGAALGVATGAGDGTSAGKGHVRFEIVPIAEDVTAPVRPALLVLVAIVATLLAATSVNIAALLLTRANARTRELAIRSALGASRQRLIRQMVAEGVLLALAGGLCGAVLAWLTPSVTSLPVLSDLPRFGDLAVGWRVVGFAAATTAVTALAFSLAPALHATHASAVSCFGALRTGGRGSAAVRHGRHLVSAQIALASIALTAALSLAHVLVTLLGRDTGFSAERVVTLHLSLPHDVEPDRIAPFFDAVLDEARRLPGVETVAAVTQLPLSGAELGSGVMREAGTPDADRVVAADLRGITADYFDALDISLLAGRAFDARDRSASAPVAIVDAALARRLWPGRSAIGQRLRWIRQPDVAVEVVGVVASIRHSGPDAEPKPTIYRPHTQYVRGTMTLLAESAGEASTIAPALKAAVHRVAPMQPAGRIETMENLADRAVAGPGFAAAAGAAVAAMAVVLAAVGVYGLFAMAVGERRKELAIRVAIGASSGSIMQLLVADALGIAGAGLLIGLPIAAWTVVTMPMHAGSVAASPRLPLVVASFVLALVALAACWLPARRAARVDPMVALRSE